MVAIVLLLMVGTATGIGVLVLVSLLGGADQDRDLEIEHENWRRANAEVISVLRTSNRTFLLVRYLVGTSLIRNDVRYPLPGAVPPVGRRVPIRYDPLAPARVVFDVHPLRRTPPRAARPRRPVTRSS
ncbi:hypothetical protein EV652_104369 [Kribbella steppae]|uniref:Uncharacterized protein n=1 Tax=Kribbella steppae TaxID=2512223 RepID=A0A4R2HNJ7_9ACTN|nr:hypothetical protein [Kribbella steppae]TCO32763.1 hypothetical protein EV652_104369 [Kribbella steppae]